MKKPSIIKNRLITSITVKKAQFWLVVISLEKINTYLG